MEGYSILFVSKGMEQNIILFFPFHFWWHNLDAEECSYVYWDESSVSATHFFPDKYSWSEFSQKVPKRFFTYLRTWESLESKLLPLIPDSADSSNLMDLRGTMTLVSQVYEFKEGNPPQWVLVVEEKVNEK